MNSLDYLVFGVSHNPQTAYKDFENGVMTDEHDDTSGADLPPTGVRKTLSENLSALREAMPQGGVRAWAKRLGIGEATISRALAGKENVRIDSLEALAKGFEVEPWQLLVPGLKPDQPPQLVDPSQKIPGLSRQQALLVRHIQSLSERELDAAIVTLRLAEEGRMDNKSPGATKRAANG